MDGSGAWPEAGMFGGPSDGQLMGNSVAFPAATELAPATGGMGPVQASSGLLAEAALAAAALGQGAPKAGPQRFAGRGESLRVFGGGAGGETSHSPPDSDSPPGEAAPYVGAKSGDSAAGGANGSTAPRASDEKQLAAKLQELANLPFDSALLWRLYQFYLGGASDGLEAAVSFVSVGDLGEFSARVRHRGVSSEYLSKVPPPKRLRNSPGPCIYRAHDASGHASGRVVSEVEPEDFAGSSVPGPDSPRGFLSANLPSRLEAYPQLVAELERLKCGGPAAQVSALRLLRQLRFLEDELLAGQQGGGLPLAWEAARRVEALILGGGVGHTQAE